MRIFQSFNEFICVSSVTEFSKEQNKLSSGAVYHKHHCYKSFFNFFLIVFIHRGVINFEFNFTFHIILIYNRAILNNRVTCVDFFAFLKFLQIVKHN